MKAFRDASNIGLELFEGMDNLVGGERGKVIDPAVACGDIHENNSITKNP